MAIYGSYSEIYDMQTADDNITALKFHTPQDGAPVEHLGGLFAQFRKYKYLGVEMALIPAQQLPLDPLQVSSVDGDGLVDPRDVLNPILHKAWNGERTLLDNYIDAQRTTPLEGTGGVGKYSDGDGYVAGQSIEGVRVPMKEGQTGIPGLNASQFYSMQLMDNSFKVSHVQETLRIRMRPKVWDVQSQRPITSYALAGGSQASSTNTSNFKSPSTPEMGTAGTPDLYPGTEVIHGRVPALTGGANVQKKYYSDQEFLTAGMKPMGWLPTNNTFSSLGMVAGSTLSNSNISELSRIRLPKIYMHLMIMPPAFKQNFYYRLVMKHKFLFNSMTSLKAIDSIDAFGGYYNRSEAWLKTAKDRLEILADASTHTDGSKSSIETFNTELIPMGGRFEFEEGVGDTYDDGSDAVELKSLEEQINEILDKRPQKEE